VKAGTELTVARMCQLAGFSRAGYYRSPVPVAASSAEALEVRDALQKIALEWPAYGTRRVKAELEKRAGK
jgi:putative transposase